MSLTRISITCWQRFTHRLWMEATSESLNTVANMSAETPYEVNKCAISAAQDVRYRY